MFICAVRPPHIRFCLGGLEPEEEGRYMEAWEAYADMTSYECLEELLMAMDLAYLHEAKSLFVGSRRRRFREKLMISWQISLHVYFLPLTA